MEKTFRRFFYGAIFIRKDLENFLHIRDCDVCVLHSLWQFSSTFIFLVFELKSQFSRKFLQIHFLLHSFSSAIINRFAYFFSAFTTTKKKQSEKLCTLIILWNKCFLPQLLRSSFFTSQNAIFRSICRAQIFEYILKWRQKKMFFLGEHIAVQYTIKKELMAL